MRSLAHSKAKAYLHYKLSNHSHSLSTLSMLTRIRIRISFFLLLFSCLQATAQDRIKLEEGLSILLPPEFSPLSPDEINKQHSQKTYPLAVYEHIQDRRTQWTFTLRPSLWQEKDTQLMKNFLRANIEALYEGKVSWLQQQTQSIDGRAAVCISFIGSRRPEATVLHREKTSRDYHMLLSMVLGRKQLLVHFSCPAGQYKHWQQKIKDVVNSLRIP